MKDEFRHSATYLLPSVTGQLRRNSVVAPQGQGAREEAAGEEQEPQAVSSRDGAGEEAAEAKSVDLPDGGQWQVTCDEDACEVGQGHD